MAPWFGVILLLSRHLYDTQCFFCGDEISKIIILILPYIKN